jgi:hypothetical protein
MFLSPKLHLNLAGGLRSIQVYWDIGITFGHYLSTLVSAISLVLGHQESSILTLIFLFGLWWYDPCCMTSMAPCPDPKACQALQVSSNLNLSLNHRLIPPLLCPMILCQSLSSAAYRHWETQSRAARPTKYMDSQWGFWIQPKTWPPPTYITSGAQYICELGFWLTTVFFHK